LPSEFYAVQLSAPEATPQLLLRISLRTSKFSRSISA
jgi:hypothetical protein